MEDSKLIDTIPTNPASVNAKMKASLFNMTVYLELFNLTILKVNYTSLHLARLLVYFRLTHLEHLIDSHNLTIHSRNDNQPYWINALGYEKFKYIMINPNSDFGQKIIVVRAACTKDP
jgi:hypothetical protein